MTMLNDLRRLFGLVVIGACVGICISSILLVRQLTTVTTHGLERRHGFEDFEVIDHQDDDIVVDTAGPVVNPHPYNFTINNPDLCRCSNDSDKDQPLILVYIYTAPRNFRQRDRIRQTWAKRDNYRGITLRTIFILGHVQNSQLQAELEMEAQRHGDIVQENFVDAYE